MEAIIWGLGAALLAGVTSDLGSLVLVHSVGRGGAMLPSTAPYGKAEHAQGAAGSLRACGANEFLPSFEHRLLGLPNLGPQNGLI